MFISKRELKSLTDRIEWLEKNKAPARVTVRGYRGAWYSSDDHLSVPLETIVKLFADHMGLEFDSAPAVPEKALLKQKAK